MFNVSLKSSSEKPISVENKNSISSKCVDFPDGRSYDPIAVKNITQDWVNEYMSKREDEFTEVVSSKIFCGTWNVNAKKIDSRLDEWLFPSDNISDLYVIGFQEIVDLNAVNVALDNKTQQRSQYWQEKIQESFLSRNLKYQLLPSKSMVGILLCIFAKESIVSKLNDIRVSQLGVGFIGLMGNKGGVSIRLSFYDSSICFICSHLAAHQQNVQGRNNDFQNIFDKTIFTSNSDNIRNRNDNIEGDGDMTVIRNFYGSARYIDCDVNVLDHDYVFWLGDLNYRIDDPDHTIDEIFSIIQTGEYGYLLSKDQLNIEKYKGNCFHNFHEGQITFPPTYKYQPGTNIYEARPEKKKRIPAWCDRILYLINEKNIIMNPIEVLQYQAIESILVSDHKPVYCEFQCKLKSIIKSKEDIIFQEAMSKLEYHKKMNIIPMIHINHEIVNFNSLKYNIMKKEIIILSNNESCLLHWRFIKKLEEDTICKSWIHVNKTNGILLPNEKMEIMISIKIDMKTAQRLNKMQEILEDVLVLRIENGLEKYIHIHGNYHRSCYGMSLEELIYTFSPVRETSHFIGSKHVNNNNSYLQLTSNEIQEKSNSKQIIPKELWRLVDMIWTSGGLKEKDLFNDQGNVEEKFLIREALDCGSEFTLCSIHSYVSAFQEFMIALPEPIISLDDLPETEMPLESMKVYTRKLLEHLSIRHYNIFIYLMSFFREVLVLSEYNRSTPSNIANIAMQCFAFQNINEIIDKEKNILKLENLEKIIEYLLVTPTI